MIGWLRISLLATAAAVLALALLLILRRCFLPKTRKPLAIQDAERSQSMQNGIARLHQVSPHHTIETQKPNNPYVFRRGFSTKPFFNWSDHPSLVTDAVESGWPQFAFTSFTSSPSVKTARSILGVCAASDRGNEIEIGWEVCEGSADFMQKVRMNPNLKRVSVNSSMAALSVIRTGLPLPGPHLGNSCFPQEAYFEITILGNYKEKEETEGEKIKLIEEDFNTKINPDSLTHVKSSQSQRKNKIEEMKSSGKNEVIFVCVGLTGGGTLPMKFPGSFPASIGFNSSGSVYLDGTKLVFESEKNEWGRADQVIGCGYNPSQRKVFFTVDSQLVHEIHCKTEEFGFPLYPTLAANADVVVIVNLGQSPFRYEPANASRTSNPCFFNGPLASSPALGDEDSKELFSMGRIDSQWLQRSATRSSNNNTVNSIKALEYDQESEGDLFEIVLDSVGRSPYTPTYQ